MAQGLKISIKTNAADARHYFDSLSRSQLPFAMSKTVNDLAKLAKGFEQGKINDYFDVRTPWLKKSGAMPIIWSNKRQAPDIHAILGVKDEVAALAAIGGDRKSEGGGLLAIPFSNTGEGKSARSILNPGRETLPRSKWPSKIVKEPKRAASKRRRRGVKPKPFYIKSKTGRQFVALRSSSSPLSLLFLYEFKSSVRVGKTWPFVDNVTAWVGNNYDNILSDNLDQAVRTIRV